MALESDELPDWADEGKLGLDLYYDERTYEIMEKAVKDVIEAKGNRLATLRDVLLGRDKAGLQRQSQALSLPELNESQNAALNLIVRSEEVAAIHGPPGTGKTTTLVRSIVHTCKTEKQVLVCAASNLAVDLLTEKLAESGLFVLRLGHPARVSEEVLKHSLDVQVSLHHSFQEMKQYRKDAEKIRQKALKFKRQFGKEERAQRKEMLNEARQCQQHARSLEQSIFQDLINEARVITGTSPDRQLLVNDRPFHRVLD